MTETEDAVARWLHEATPQPDPWIDPDVVWARALLRRRRHAAIGTLAAVVPVLAGVGLGASLLRGGPGETVGTGPEPVLLREAPPCARTLSEDVARAAERGRRLVTVPPDAKGRICRYAGMNEPVPAGRLTRQAPLSPADVASFVRLLAAATPLPTSSDGSPAVRHCPMDDATFTVVRLAQADGWRDVVVPLNGCAFVTGADGHTSGGSGVREWVAARVPTG